MRDLLTTGPLNQIPRLVLRPVESVNDDTSANDDEEVALLRPTLDVTADLSLLVDRSLRLLAQDPSLFQKGGELVILGRDEGGQVRLRRAKGSQLRYLLSKHASWANDEKPCHPPSSISSCIVDQSSWEHVRSLRTVVPFPVLSSSGRIRSEPGYDGETRTFYGGEGEIRTPDEPSEEEARQAVATLLDVVQDFPFADDAHRSAWLAALLTPLSRLAHDGNVPLVLVQANAPRVGKTRLVQVISEILTGAESPAITQTRSEDDTRKRALPLLREARPIVLIDNVTGTFGGATTNAIITSRTFEDRVLGRSSTVSCENLTTWFITGNNVTLSADTPERCLHIRLHCEDESPNLRAGFRYPDLFAVVRERRAELLSSALVILKAFIVAGMPEQGLPAWGSFESWSRLVRGALVWAGMPDPAVTRYELEADADVETDVKALLVAGIEELQIAKAVVGGLRATDILDIIRTTPDEVAPTLRAALVDIATAPSLLPDPKTLSRHLRDAKGRNLRGLVLRCDPDPKAAHRWRVERVEVKGTGG
jgi:hypothetical protein